MLKRKIYHRNLDLISNTPLLPQLQAKNSQAYKNWKKSLSKRPDPWNKGKSKETCFGVRKISNTMKSKKIDNLANWRKDNLKFDYPDFIKNNRLAELIGLVLGDGSLYRHERTERLLISFNSQYPEIVKRGRDLLFTHFQKEPAVSFNKNKTCTRLSIYEKKISVRLGIPAGDKRRFNLFFPEWIWQSRKTILSCLVGLYNAEGSLSVYRPSQAYIMSFSNKNETLLKDVFRALKMLKYNPNLRKDKVNLRRKKEIVSFCQEIRFYFYRGPNYCRVE